jgi:DNA-binding response OmpR family regulator
MDERILLIDVSDVPPDKRHGELIIHKFPFRIGRMPSIDENEITNLDLRESDLELIETGSPYNASRNHVEIGFSSGRPFVRDTGSMKGTLVNNVAIGGNRRTESTFVHGGENTLVLGDSKSPWRFRVIVQSGDVRPRMVIADDEQPVQELLETAFSPDYDVVTTNCGYDALQACVNEHPDVVLLDWQMPDISGVKICQTLKGNVRTATIPVILVTGMGRTENLLTGMNAGVDEYITKPFDIEKMRARVAAVLSRRRCNRNLHWLSGIASEAGLQAEFDRLSPGEAATRELIVVTAAHLGRYQAESGSTAAEAISRRISEIMWQQSLTSDRAVPAQLTLERWCMLTPRKGIRQLQSNIELALKKLLRDTPVTFKVRRIGTSNHRNYRDLAEAM